MRKFFKTREYLTILACTLICVALAANLRALRTSPVLSSPCGIVTITEVLDPPPKEPCHINLIAKNSDVNKGRYEDNSGSTHNYSSNSICKY